MHQRYSATAFVAAAILASVMFTAPAVAAASADDTVIAIVNGHKILKKDVMHTIKSLNVKTDADTKKIFPAIVDEIINQKLIDEASNDAKVEQTEDYKTKLSLLKARLAHEIYLEKALKDKVSDAAVKAEYKKFKEGNQNLQEVHARHLLVKTEEEAKQAIKDLESGEKFEALAKSRSSDPGSASTGGELGWFAEGEMVPEFSEAAFKLKPGEFTKEPVKTAFGWHVIKVEGKRFREVPELKMVEGEIRKKLAQEGYVNLIRKLRSKAEIKVFDMNGKPLEFGNNPGEKPSKDEKSGKAEEKPAEEKAKE